MNTIAICERNYKNQPSPLFSASAPLCHSLYSVIYCTDCVYAIIITVTIVVCEFDFFGELLAGVGGDQTHAVQGRVQPQKSKICSTRRVELLFEFIDGEQ